LLSTSLNVIDEVIYDSYQGDVNINALQRVASMELIEYEIEKIISSSGSLELLSNITQDNFNKKIEALLVNTLDNGKNSPLSERVENFFNASDKLNNSQSCKSSVNQALLNIGVESILNEVQNKLQNSSLVQSSNLAGLKNSPHKNLIKDINNPLSNANTIRSLNPPIDSINIVGPLDKITVRYAATQVNPQTIELVNLNTDKSSFITSTVNGSNHEFNVDFLLSNSVYAVNSLNGIEDNKYTFHTIQNPLMIGSTAIVQNTGGIGLNLRQNPTTNSNVINVLSDLTEVDIIGDPVYGESYTWWQVLTSQNITGWVAQGTDWYSSLDENYGFAIGSKIEVTASALNRRLSPSTEFNSLGKFNTSLTYKIIDGPILNDGFTWWYLYHPDGSGWAAMNAWLVPLECLECGSDTPPDLIVNNLGTSLTELEIGQQFNISADVTNIGNGPSESTRLKYYLSSNSTITTSDLELSNDDYVRDLAPNEISAENDNQNAPQTPGSYYVGACVVAVSGESNESNNCTDGILINVSDPSVMNDFYLESPTISATNIKAGEVLSLTVDQVYSGNSENSLNPIVTYYISDDSILSEDEIIGSDRSSIFTGDLVDSEKADVSIPTHLSSGLYHVYMKADSEEEYAETNENNNIVSIPITVEGLNLVNIDFYIENMILEYTAINGSANPIRVFPGDEIEIKLDQYFSGESDGAVRTKVAYYFSDTLEIFQDDFIDDDISTISPTDLYDTESQKFTIPANTQPGEYYILAQADYLNQYIEIDEANNFSYKKVIVETELRNELYLSDPGVFYLNLTTSSPFIAAPGQTIFLETTAVYDGNSKVALGTETGYYFSADDILAPDELLDSDFSTLSVIEQYNVENNNVTIPIETPLGDYRIYFVADILNAVNEENENNNVLSIPIIIMADSDSDFVADVKDNCPGIMNQYQLDSDTDGFGDVCDPDDDNDQMEDTFETFYGLDPYNANDDLLDLDNDGISNYDEYLAGTDPSIPNAPNQEHSTLTRSAISKQLLIKKYGSGYLPALIKP